MKFKNVLLAFVAVCATNIATAQVRDVPLVEGGLSVGVMFPSVNLFDTAGYPGGQVAAELRFNTSSKFDVGTQVSMSRFKQEGLFLNHPDVVAIFTPSVLFDYNWRPSEMMNMFVGAGFGFPFCVDGPDVAAYVSGFEAFPRVGVEFYDRLRFTADYRVNFAGCGYAGFTIGYVFGGRPK